MTDKIEVRVKEGCKHGLMPEGHDPAALPKGSPGPKAVGGDVIMVTEAELVSFGDKFEVLPQPKRRGRKPKAAAKSAEAKEPIQD